MRPFLALALLLAACSHRSPPPPAPPPLTTGFVAGSLNVVEVTMVDRQPVEQASLIRPDGKGIIAYQIDYDRLMVASDPGIAAGLGLGVFGGTYSNGVSSGFGLGLPLFGSPPPSAEPVIQSHALIRLDDMMAYRAGWANWKLHLRLGSPETSERDVEFPAPRPPDG